MQNKTPPGALPGKTMPSNKSLEIILWGIYFVLIAPYALVITTLAQDVNPFLIAFSAALGIGTLGAIVGWNVSAAVRYFWKAAPRGSILIPVCSSAILACYYAVFGLRLATQG